MSWAYNRRSKLMLSVNCSTRRSVAWSNTPPQGFSATHASPAVKIGLLSKTQFFYSKWLTFECQRSEAAPGNGAPRTMSFGMEGQTGPFSATTGWPLRSETLASKDVRGFIHLIRHTGIFCRKSLFCHILRDAFSAAEKRN